MAINILHALEKASIWMNTDGIEGVAEGEKDGESCIVVFISKPSSKFNSIIPDIFMDFPVVIEQSGIINAQD